MEDDLRFARWLANLGGWAHADSATDFPAATNWVADRRAALRGEGHAQIIHFTTAGQAWCRENGIG